MIISQLICRLEEIKEQFGDAEVLLCGNDAEFDILDVEYDPDGIHLGKMSKDKVVILSDVPHK